MPDAPIGMITGVVPVLVVALDSELPELLLLLLLDFEADSVVVLTLTVAVEVETDDGVDVAGPIGTGSTMVGDDEDAVAVEDAEDDSDDLVLEALDDAADPLLEAAEDVADPLLEAGLGNSDHEL